MTKDIDVRWHALYVASRCEKVVATKLRALGIDTIVPTQKQTRQWSDRKKVIDIVLFPNYVFLAINKYQYQTVVKIDRVVGFVRFGGQVAVLSEREVELIKHLGLVEHPVVIRSDKLCTGVEVEIISGPMKKHRGHILHMNGSTKVQIAIPSLRSFAQIIIDRSEVRIVEQ